MSVDAAAYDYVLSALSINATACEYMKVVTVLGSALLRKCGSDVAYLVSAVGSPFFTPHIDVARVRHWFGEVNGFPQISRLLQVLSSDVPLDVAPDGDLQAEIAYGNHLSSESHTRAVRAKIVQDSVNRRAFAFKRSSVSDIRGLRVSPLGAVEGRKL